MVDNTCAPKFRRSIREQKVRNSNLAVTELRAGKERLAQGRPRRAARLFAAIVLDELPGIRNFLFRRQARVAELVRPYQLAGIVVTAGQELIGQSLGLA